MTTEATVVEYSAATTGGRKMAVIANGYASATVVPRPPTRRNVTASAADSVATPPATATAVNPPDTRSILPGSTGQGPLSHPGEDRE